MTGRRSPPRACSPAAPGCSSGLQWRRGLHRAAHEQHGRQPGLRCRREIPGHRVQRWLDARTGSAAPRTRSGHRRAAGSAVRTSAGARADEGLAVSVKAGLQWSKLNRLLAAGRGGLTDRRYPACAGGADNHGPGDDGVDEHRHDRGRGLAVTVYIQLRALVCVLICYGLEGWAYGEVSTNGAHSSGYRPSRASSECASRPPRSRR